MKKPEQIVVLSGKGGTGKTTVTASLAVMFPDKVIADADVDAANLHILLDPAVISEHTFPGRPVAEINPKHCINCGICMDLCRFDAIGVSNGQHHIDEFSCEGCTLCSIACPEHAIAMTKQTAGRWFNSSTAYGSFIYARLDPGAENSGNLVTMVKHQSRLTAESEEKTYILIDGPPGIGCPVTSALSGSDFAVIVTEPSLTAISDLDSKRDRHQ
jgi:MinD superfamily P-loop ATPase